MPGQRAIPVLVLLVLAALFLGGCANQKWCHKVATTEEAQKFDDICLNEALARVGKLTSADEPSTVSREHAKCMRGYGFFPCR